MREKSRLSGERNRNAEQRTPFSIRKWSCFFLLGKRQPYQGILMQKIETRHNRLRCACSCCTLLLCIVGWMPDVLGDWRDDIGYTKLINSLGAAVPNGAGVPISLVEAIQIKTDDMGTPSTADDVITSRSYKPNLSSLQFSSDSDPLAQNITFIDGSNNACEGSCISFSPHAQDQAQTFFGNTTSVAPAANEVTLYEANDYLDNILNLNGSNTAFPDVQDFRVQNFSWIGTFDSDSKDREALRRFDYAIDANNITAVVGLNNGTGILPHLLSHSYNAIAVGRSDGNHSIGLTNLTGYGIGRSKPDLVAPRPTASAATSSVSSAAAFLHSADTVLGTDAANSETMKAILLTGATKDEFPTWSQIDSGGVWRPLDDTYGAGELNLYNSYLVTLGGQAVGSTSSPTPAGSYGWDFQTIQPGASNALLYDFVIPGGSTAEELSIVLAWNAKIESPFNTGDPIVANLNLELVDANGATVDFDTEDTIVEGLSASAVSNVEHLYLTDLAAGTYTLRVSSEDLASDFGLSWRTSRLFDTFSADFDEDGDTDGADFLTWQRGFGTLINATRASGDADGDGDVDEDDLAFLNTALMGGGIGLSRSLFAVPEPASWVFVCIALLLALGLGNDRLRFGNRDRV